MQWDILQQRDIYTSKADNIVAAFSSGLGQQADALSYEKDKLVSDISHTQGLVEEFKDKYEDEINRRTELENDFVLLKKEVDDAYLQRVDLESKVEGLGDEIDFLKQLYDEVRASHANHMPITCQSHANHMPITCQLHFQLGESKEWG
uniref:IF rod domain-containing protein n=1 Tax=Callorhinchus milii TaxID=7868 RepID=A0A4W3GLZ1_CALMI